MLRRETYDFLRQLLGGIENEITDYLIKTQQLTSNPIVMEPGFVTKWGVRYWGAVRRAAIHYSEALARSIGLRKGLGSKDVRWILREIGSFYRDALAGAVPTVFLSCAASGVAEIHDLGAANLRFRDVVMRYANIGLLMTPVREALSCQVNLYGRTKKLRAERVEPTPQQKLANPETFPTMSAKEIAPLFGVSRSTVDRWVDEDKLERAGAGKKPGKRARLLILTASVMKLLDESSN